MLISFRGAFGSLREEVGNTRHVQCKCSRERFVEQITSADIRDDLAYEIILAQIDLQCQRVNSITKSLTLASPFQLTVKVLARHASPIRILR